MIGDPTQLLFSFKIRQSQDSFRSAFVLGHPSSLCD